MPQARLTRHERKRLPLGNQYTSIRRKPIMCWQAIKGAAVEEGVNDWTSRVDPTLTYEENIDLMRQAGISREKGLGATVKELRAREAIRCGWS